MSNKGMVKRLAPGPLWSVLHLAPGPLREAARELHCRFSWKAVKSLRRLRRFRNAYRGRRCFIIGNGPSLKRTDLSLLRDEVTFGLNRIYLAFDELGFATTFLVSVNRLVIKQCADEMTRLPCTKFMNWHARGSIALTRDMMFLRSRYPPKGKPFYRNPEHGICEGSTVTYVAMQLAFYMGFGEVVLIGVDHSFATKGPPCQEVVSSGDDRDHFDPRYFGKGFRWNLPDLEDSERHYRIARAVFEADGRRIVDATIGGKLEVFPKVDYLSLFRK